MSALPCACSQSTRKGPALRRHRGALPPRACARSAGRTGRGARVRCARAELTWLLAQHFVVPACLRRARQSQTSRGTAAHAAACFGHTTGSRPAPCCAPFCSQVSSLSLQGCNAAASQLHGHAGQSFQPSAADVMALGVAVAAARAHTRTPSGCAVAVRGGVALVHRFAAAPPAPLRLLRAVPLLRQRCKAGRAPHACRRSARVVAALNDECDASAASATPRPLAPLQPTSSAGSRLQVRSRVLASLHAAARAMRAWC